MGFGLCPGEFGAPSPHFVHLSGKPWGCYILQAPPLAPAAPGKTIHQGGQEDHSPDLKNNSLPKEKQHLGLSCPEHPSAVTRKTPHQGEGDNSDPNIS